MRCTNEQPHLPQYAPAATLHPLLCARPSPPSPPSPPCPVCPSLLRVNPAHPTPRAIRRDTPPGGVLLQFARDGRHTRCAPGLARPRLACDINIDQNRQKDDGRLPAHQPMLPI
eukprot:1071462-Prorocentrum_minimum.AAC.1